jgi:hypothetical protein
LELCRRLKGTTDRPDPEGNHQPPDVALTEQEWHHLEQLAGRIAASTDLKPSPDQVGRALLSLALRSVMAEPPEKAAETTAVLVNELAAHPAS